MAGIACVTGATGCVGRNVVDVLLRHGWTVRVLHRRSSDLSRLYGADVETVEADLTSRESLCSSIPAQCDAVFHCAGNTSHVRSGEMQQLADNVDTTDAIGEVCRLRGVGRLVYTSTAAVWRYRDIAPQCIPIPYVRSKRLAEFTLDAIRGLDYVIVRPTIVVGPYDWNSYAKIFEYVRRSIGPPLAFHGEIEFAHAGDVAMGHLLAWKHGQRGERIHLGGERRPWLEFFQEVALCVGGKPPRRATPERLLRALAAGGELLDRIGVAAPLTRDLIDLCCHDPVFPPSVRASAERIGYRSRSMEVAVADCWEWLNRPEPSASAVRPAAARIHTLSQRA